MRDIILLTRQGLGLLSNHGRKVLIIYLVSVIAIASLDGIALYLIAKLFSTQFGLKTSDVASDLNLMLLVAVIVLFVLKSVLSTLATWISLNGLAKQEVEIGQKRFKAIRDSSLEERLKLKESDYFTAIDRAPTTLVQGLLVGVVNFFAELVNALVILGVVLVIQPTTAVVAFTYFILIALVQHRLLSPKIAREGQVIYKNGNGTYELLADYFHMGKLLQVSKSRTYDSELNQQRSELAIARAKQSFIALVPRYLLESMLALGLLVIGGTTWLLDGKDSVLPSLAIFAAAGFRLIPIVNRLQGLVLGVVGCAPLARQALTPLPTGVDVNEKKTTNVPVDSRNIMELVGVDFTYPSGLKPVLEGVNITFREGLQYAIVGPSGAGKTTLLDICLGLLTPQKGEVLVKLDKLGDFFGYVPQDTHVSAASISGNVALEWDSSMVDLEMVRHSLTSANLEEFFNSDLNDEKLNENFEKMSGGQRQRLGLARALYRNGKFLVLDEATSSLDAITESEVMKTVKAMRGSATVIIVAHRLSTVKDADQVIYLEGGKVLGMGTFSELRQKLPQFEEQIRLGSLMS